MTKYYSDKNKFIQDKDTPISLPNYERIETDAHTERFCPYCSFKLSRLIDSSGSNPSFYCSKCTIEYADKAEVKSKSRLSTPQKSNNEHPAVAFPPEVCIGRKKKELTGSFKVLRDKGMRFTSVTESNTKR